MTGAIKKAQEITESIKEAISLKQFDNEANPAWHEATTGPEIYRDLNGEISVFVAGVGKPGEPLQVYLDT